MSVHEDDVATRSSTSLSYTHQLSLSHARLTAGACSQLSHSSLVQRSMSLTIVQESALDLPGRAVSNDIPTFSITPYGILAYIPIVVIGGEIFGDLYWSWYDGTHALLSLVENPGSRESSSRRPSYRAGIPRMRICGIGATGDYRIRGEKGRASWQEVFIRHRPSPLPGLSGQLSDPRTVAIPAMPVQLTLDAPYRFDEACIREFMVESKANRVEIRNARFPSNSNPPTIYAFPIRQRYTPSLAWIGSS